MIARFFSAAKRYFFVCLAFTAIFFVLGFGGLKFLMIQSTPTNLTSVDTCTCTLCGGKGSSHIPVYQRLGYATVELCRADVEKTVTAIRQHLVQIWFLSLLPPSLRPACETLNMCFVWREQESYGLMAASLLLFAFVSANLIAIRNLRGLFKNYNLT